MTERFLYISSGGTILLHTEMPITQLITPDSLLSFPIALSTTEQAKFVAGFMRDFVKGFWQSVSYTDMRCSFNASTDLDCPHSWRSSKDAFNTALLEADSSYHDRAFAFDSFKDAMLSHVVG
ncbi:hypothetical protein V5O48_017505 [Marasmius crinis-equi]|uniref:Uncharacterized protein n=1 Tax=Marasmius crinis-equi TaxID=585013 RepID=A0ABR3ENS5_9AGAR